jgi:hypothetical protein
MLKQKKPAPTPSSRPPTTTAERLRAGQRTPQAPAAPQTPEQQWRARYLQEQERVIDPTVSRWKRLSTEEAAALQLVPAAERPAAGQSGYAATVNGVTWQYGAHAVDPQDPLRAKDMMGGNPEQVHSRAFVTRRGGEGEDADAQDVTILNRDGTVSTQRSNAHGMAELPESGFGFTTHNRNDVRVNGKRQPDQWGSPQSVARTMNIMADYRTMFPNSTLSIGDMSDDTGNSPLLYDNRSARHATHYSGSQVDMQYAHGEGSRAQRPTSADDLFRQRSFLRIAENWGMDYFHMAPGMNTSDMFLTEGADDHYNSGHSDHLHMGRGRGTR